MSATIFWAFIGINTFLAVFLKKEWFELWDFPVQPLEIVTHTLAFGFPTICGIIGLAAGKFTFYDGGAFCFLNRDDGGWWQYSLFYIPVGICIAIGFTCMVCVMWEMRNIKGSADSSKYYKHFRVIFFLFIFCYLFAFIFAYRFYLVDHETSFNVAFTNYAACGLTQQVTNQTCIFNPRPDHGLFLVFCVDIAISAIAITVLFGTTKETLQFWADRFINLRNGRNFFSGIPSVTSKSSSKQTRTEMS